jgi:serine/threonine protein phosphatase 1
VILRNFLQSVLGPKTAEHPARAHMSAPERPAVIYGVGDIHGRLDLLRLMHEQIFADAAAIQGEKWIVYLGDYVDRGPGSAGVLDVLLAPLPAGFRGIALAGNHEALMQDFMQHPTRDSRWLELGGVETLASYGLDAKRLLALPERERRAHLLSHIPPEHLDLVASLPLTLSVPGLVFVHAGLRYGVPVEAQTEDDTLWIRQEFHSAPPVDGRLVIHGHTPAKEPVVAPGRICVDTGAFATGILTAVKITGDEQPGFITVAAAPPPL